MWFFAGFRTLNRSTLAMPEDSGFATLSFDLGRAAQISLAEPLCWWLGLSEKNLSMIVCEDPAFIFVHVFKTAGTSIKRALRQYAMPAWQEYANSVLKRIGISQFGPPDFPDHLLARELVEQIGIEKFKRYYSFAFVRNPWDWELSHYKFIMRLKRHPQHEHVVGLKSFSEYVRWRCDGHFQLQEEFLTLNDQVIVDFVGRFEDLDRDFQVVCDQIGVTPKLTKRNSTRKTKYQEHYDDRSAELIRQTYRRDIIRFGYQFESSKSDAA